MENHETRTMFVGSKVNKQEYDKIKNLAEKCGMTVSRYMRETALGYEPRHTLTEKETGLLENLAHVRGDIIKFFNAYGGLSAEERRTIFRRTDAMQKWRDILMSHTDEIQKFLDKVGRRTKQ